MLMGNSLSLSDWQWKHDLISSIQVGIVVLDRDFQVKVWNQFMQNHSNITEQEIIDTSLFEHFNEIDPDWFRAKAQPLFRLRSPAYLIWEQRPYLFKFLPSRPVSSASEFMYQNITMFPLTSLSGEVEQVCLMVFDVTDEALSKKGMQALNHKLQQISRIDGLTGLYNRRFWEEQLELEFKRSRRNEKPASLMMLDIDHFKSINDQYGHLAGDQVIRTLATILGHTVRETDICGRYGGEEFCVLLPETSSRRARLVAERVRHQVQETLVHFEQRQIQFTVSLGLAELNHTIQSPVTWLEKTDQALYQAKESGRNQVRIA